MVAEVFFHKDFMGIDGTPEWSFRGAVILPGGVKRVCSSVKSGVLLRNSRSALLARIRWPVKVRPIKVGPPT